MSSMALSPPWSSPWVEAGALLHGWPGRRSLVATNRTSCPPGHGFSFYWPGQVGVIASDYYHLSLILYTEQCIKIPICNNFSLAQMVAPSAMHCSFTYAPWTELLDRHTPRMCHYYQYFYMLVTPTGPHPSIVHPRGHLSLWVSASITTHTQNMYELQHCCITSMLSPLMLSIWLGLKEYYY